MNETIGFSENRAFEPSKEKTREEKFSELFSVASHTRQVVMYLEKHPFCQQEELELLSLKYTTGKTPEIRSLGRILLGRRQRVWEASDWIQEYAVNHEKTYEETLYQAMLPMGLQRKPTEKIERSYKDNPFAIILIAGPDDFRALDPWDSAGHFISPRTFYLDGKVASNVSFPSIAVQRSVRGKEVSRILKHETGHAYSDALMEAFKKTGKHRLWGSNTRLSRNTINRIQKGINNEWTSVVKGRIPQALSSRMIYDYMISRGKDELIADYFAIGDFSVKLADLKFPHGFYDYIKVFKISNPMVESSIWESYSAALDREVPRVNNLIKLYGSLGLSRRLDVLPWILMRIPLNEWSAKFQELGIFEEASRLKGILNFQKAYYEQRGGKGSRIAGQTLARVVDKHLASFRRKQQHLLLDEISRCEKDIVPFIKEIGGRVE